MTQLRTLALLLTISLAGGIAAEPTAKPVDKPLRYEFRDDHDPDGIGKFYMGREIARVMGHQAAGWLERPEREKEEAPSMLLKALKIKEGDVVADIGAGSGYHTLRMSPMVGDKGLVYAVDIQQQMLALLRHKARSQGMKNVKLIRGTESDPKLPANSIDLILMVDVYHEFDYPWEMTAAMVEALKVGGRLAFVEFRSEDPKVPIKEVHKMSKRQVTKEMEAHPLVLDEAYDKLPWQHLLIFKKKVVKPKQ